MKILFTGATGVIGRSAVPLLTKEGHDVTALARSGEDREWLDSVGARTVALDLFDAAAVSEVMAGIDTVIHYATSIPPLDRFGKREAWAVNDRLRSEATGILVDAALSNGVRRFVQQSITFFYADRGDQWIDESSPVAPQWDVLDSALDAESHVDRFRSGGGAGVVLRLARLYGPGRASDDFVDAVVDRKMPIVGKGTNFVSSLHTHDAAAALGAALTAPDGVYNVADDEPVTAVRYGESLAELLGAPKPRHVPVVLARFALGKAVGLVTNSHRISSQSLKRATGWVPKYPSVVDGWADIVASRG